MTTYCHGQSSISAGTSRVRESFFNNNAPFFGQPQRHLYNSFALQADYTKSFLRAYTELGYLPASFEVIKATYESQGGGSSQIYKNDNVYHSKVNFTYFTVKAGLGLEFKKLIKKNGWYSFSSNLFIQYEKLIDEKTSENVRYQTTTHYGITTVYPPSYYSFDLLSIEDNIFQLGIELKQRLGFQNYFVEFSTSLSRSNVYRTRDVNVFDDYSERKITNWGLNASLKFGYYFVRKPKKSK